MATDSEQFAASPKIQANGFARIGYFSLHFLEMCIVMCAGGIATLSALLRWVGAWIGYPDPRSQFAEGSTILLAIWLALLMIGWMRFRKHDWRPTLEMASTSLVALPFVTGAAWLGVIPMSRLFSLECGLACAFMLVPMLVNLDHYAGRHGDHRAASQHGEHSEHHGHG